jgi:hypothetical protein
VSAAHHAFEARPAPPAELRTSLGLASLAAALVHVMGAAHGGVLVMSLAAAAVHAGLAALLAFTAARAVLGPAVAFNVVLTLGAGSLLAAPTQVVVAGGALALLWGASDRTCAFWSRISFAVFALAALTGFGHLTH